jgi:hypothetical protein
MRHLYVSLNLNIRTVKVLLCASKKSLIARNKRGHATDKAGMLTRLCHAFYHRGSWPLFVLFATTARASPPPSEEPSISEVQAAAVRAARAESWRPESLAHRARSAAAVPHLRFRVGRGNYLASDALGGAVSTGSDTWRVDVELAWSLDRAVYDRSEVGLLREGQRLAHNRSLVVEKVTRLYFARRRAQARRQAALAGNRLEDAAAASDEVDELTAVIDGLTDGVFGARASPHE